jgi:hypothetical protein
LSSEPIIQSSKVFSLACIHKSDTLIDPTSFPSQTPRIPKISFHIHMQPSSIYIFVRPGSSSTITATPPNFF